MDKSRYPDNDPERWEDISGYEGLYRISNQGRVWRVDRGALVALQTEKLRTHNRGGYIFVSLWRDGRRKNFKVHRLVVTSFAGRIPSGYEVNHIDGNKANNIISNLEVITRSQNIQHAIASKGLYRGENHTQSKLNEDAVRVIRTGGMSVKELAARFDVIPKTIRNVKNGKTWNHVR